MMYKKDCPFCNPYSDVNQTIVYETETCYFLQHDQEQKVLKGSGVIVPKKHRSDPFDLTEEEWLDTYALLNRAKAYLDERFSPDGYSVGWNVGEVSGQFIPHSHLHVIPRHMDEPLAGKGIRYWLKQDENKRKRK
ncbi:HIT family protein [Alkalihalobacillus algicola]|nr:HIT family protein [Alkalihalobacillus algicola]MCA0988497.1 HIT family protein [Alkalihalobacillus algicola]